MDEFNNNFPEENNIPGDISAPFSENTENADLADASAVTPDLSGPQTETARDTADGPQLSAEQPPAYPDEEMRKRSSPDPFREEDFKTSAAGMDTSGLPYNMSYRGAPYANANTGYAPPPYGNAGNVPPPMYRAGHPQQFAQPAQNAAGTAYSASSPYAPGNFSQPQPDYSSGNANVPPPQPIYAAANANVPPPPQPVYREPVPEYADAPAADNGKKLSVWGTVAVVVIIVALFMALMVFLAVSAGKDPSYDKPDNTKNTFDPFDSISESSEHSGGTVNEIHLPVSPKPVQESKYYEDEESGLLTVAGVAKTVLPSVVDVEIFGETTFYPDSRASGIIISDDGYIITNAHVVEGVGAGIKVTLNDGRDFEAQLIGKDSKTDLAVIKIDADDLSPAELGDSDQLEIGEQVAAIGNSGGYSGTLTVGYISGLNREVTVSSSGGGSGTTAECIQTDAALSPGVSGGALVNMYGQVVGITTLKYHASELYEGLGFAISMKFAKPIIEDIISQGYISGRVRIGIIYTLVTAEEADFYGVSKGILVKEISPECDISNTDLRPGDIITEINGKEVYSAVTIEKSLEGCVPGDTLTAHVCRKGIASGDTTEFDIEFKAMQDTNLD